MTASTAMGARRPCLTAWSKADPYIGTTIAECCVHYSEPGERYSLDASARGSTFHGARGIAQHGASYPDREAVSASLVRSRRARQSTAPTAIAHQRTRCRDGDAIGAARLIKSVHARIVVLVFSRCAWSALGNHGSRRLR